MSMASNAQPSESTPTKKSWCGHEVDQDLGSRGVLGIRRSCAHDNSSIGDGLSQPALLACIEYTAFVAAGAISCLRLPPGTSRSPTASASQNRTWSAVVTPEAGMLGSPASRRASAARFSDPVTSQRMPRPGRAVSRSLSSAPPPAAPNEHERLGVLVPRAPRDAAGSGREAPRSSLSLTPAGIGRHPLRPPVRRGWVQGRQRPATTGAVATCRASVEDEQEGRDNPADSPQRELARARARPLPSASARTRIRSTT